MVFQSLVFELEELKDTKCSIVEEGILVPICIAPISQRIPCSLQFCFEESTVLPGLEQLGFAFSVGGGKRVGR